MGSSAILEDVTSIATGPAWQVMGVEIDHGTPILKNVKSVASGEGSLISVGVYSCGAVAEINNSTIIGPNTLFNAACNSSAQVYIVNSKLDGGPVTYGNNGTATYTCVNSYNSTYQALAPNCQ